MNIEFEFYLSFALKICYKLQYWHQIFTQIEDFQEQDLLFFESSLCFMR